MDVAARYSRSRVARHVVAAMRARFFDLAALFTPAVALEQDGVTVWLRTSDKMPGRVTFARGVPERTTLARACQALGSARLSGGTFVDVGAHIGTATLAALAWHGFDTAVCIEPDPANAAQLRHNLATNGHTNRATVIEAAASDGSERVPFELAEENTGDGRIRLGAPQAGRFAEERRSVIEVPATTLDRCVAEGTLTLEQISLVWIDVQGHEAHVLRGAQQLLAAGLPIVFELWPYGLRRADGVEAVTELAAAAYSSAVDLRDGTRHAPGEIGNIAARLSGIDYTDILLQR